MNKFFCSVMFFAICVQYSYGSFADDILFLKGEVEKTYNYSDVIQNQQECTPFYVGSETEKDFIGTVSLKKLPSTGDRDFVVVSFHGIRENFEESDREVFYNPDGNDGIEYLESMYGNELIDHVLKENPYRYRNMNIHSGFCKKTMDFYNSLEAAISKYNNVDGYVFVGNGFGGALAQLAALKFSSKFTGLYPENSFLAGCRCYSKDIGIFSFEGPDVFTESSAELFAEYIGGRVKCYNFSVSGYRYYDQGFWGIGNPCVLIEKSFWDNLWNYCKGLFDYVWICFLGFSKPSSDFSRLSLYDERVINRLASWVRKDGPFDYLEGCIKSTFYPNLSGVFCRNPWPYF